MHRKTKKPHGGRPLSVHRVLSEGHCERFWLIRSHSNATPPANSKLISPTPKIMISFICSHQLLKFGLKKRKEWWQAISPFCAQIPRLQFTILFSFLSFLLCFLSKSFPAPDLTEDHPSDSSLLWNLYPGYVSLPHYE